MLDRRALIGGAVALAASPAIALQDPQAGALEELLADYRWAVETHAAALERFDDLHEHLLPPIPEIRFGRRRIADPETGAIRFTKWRANYLHEVDNHFAPGIALRFHPHWTKAKARRARVIRALQAKWNAWEQIRMASGVAAAENAELAAGLDVLRLKREILAYRPESAAEAASKADFILNHMNAWPLLQDEMATILRSMLRPGTEVRTEV